MQAWARRGSYMLRGRLAIVLVAIASMGCVGDDVTNTTPSSSQATEPSMSATSPTADVTTAAAPTEDRVADVLILGGGRTDIEADVADLGGVIIDSRDGVYHVARFDVTTESELRRIIAALGDRGWSAQVNAADAEPVTEN